MKKKICSLVVRRNIPRLHVIVNNCMMFVVYLQGTEWVPVACAHVPVVLKCAPQLKLCLVCDDLKFSCRFCF